MKNQPIFLTELITFFEEDKENKIIISSCDDIILTFNEK